MVFLLALSLTRGVAAAPSSALEIGGGRLRPAQLLLNGDDFYPESIGAAPNGALYVSSLVTGEIVRFPPGSAVPETFVPADVNIGTAGVVVDPLRHVLWACAVDLSFQSTSELRAFDLSTGALRASYAMPNQGVCGDIVLARGKVYATDTVGSRIVRLTTGGPLSPIGGPLEVWSADPKFNSVGFLKINGIAFNGLHSFYTANYTTGEVLKLDLAPNGSARPASIVDLGAPLSNPDGMRWFAGRLYIAENANTVSRIDPATGTRTVITNSVDQPTSLVFDGLRLWVTEGQVLRLQAGEPANLPFKVRRVPFF